MIFIFFPPDVSSFTTINSVYRIRHLRNVVLYPTLVLMVVLAWLLRHSKKRFKCLCISGFYDNLCEAKNPERCADFLTDQMKPLSRQYEIFDGTGTSYSVYCDFDSESGFAWTLLHSFSRDNGPTVGDKGLLEYQPINEDTPNWENFRLSLARMNALREHSSHWRASCGYEVYGVDYQDFSTYHFDGNNGPSACQSIGYMNIWGSQCHDCNFGVYHNSMKLPNLIPFYSKSWSQCSFHVSQHHDCATDSPAFLFVLTSWLDTQFRCHETASSTTQN